MADSHITDGSVIDKINDHILPLAGNDLAARIAVDDDCSPELAAVVVGLNMLAEEFEHNARERDVAKAQALDLAATVDLLKPLEDVLAAAPIGILVFRDNQSVHFANAVAAQLLGATIAGLKGRQLDTLLPDLVDSTT